MPAMEHTSQQLDEIRVILLDLRHNIRSEGDFKLEPNRQDAFEAPDADDDQPLNEMNQAITSRRNLVRTNHLVRVEAAITRLQQNPDDFGYCLECDAIIPYGRLKILPFATLCVDCQDAAEEPLRQGRRKSLTDYT